MFAILLAKQIFSQIELATVLQKKDLNAETAATCINTLSLYLKEQRTDQSYEKIFCLCEKKSKNYIVIHQ